MSYHIYQTEGLILRSSAHREADRFIFALTADFGLIGASASGVRLEKSKLRYSLQELSLSSLSLVRGKSGWRITNAALSQDFYAELRSERRKLQLAARILSLLQRLVAGEEGNAALFSVVVEGLRYLSAAPATQESLQNIECLLVLRMLRLLGYIGESAGLESLLASSVWAEAAIAELAPVRKDAVSLINNALRQSQL